MSRRAGICDRCSQPKPLRARGLCNTCHSAATRQHTLDLYPRVNAIRKPSEALPATSGGVGQPRAADTAGHSRPATDSDGQAKPDAPPTVTLRFSDAADRALYASLEAVARAERRTVEGQVFFLLDIFVRDAGGLP